MTKDRRQSRLQANVKRLAGMLLLKDWTLTVIIQSLPDDTLAECRADDGMQADIIVSPAFFALPPMLQERVLIHELLHCHCYNSVLYTEMMHTLIGEKLTKGEKLTLDRGLAQVEESIVETLSRVIQSLIH